MSDENTGNLLAKDFIVSLVDATQTMKRCSDAHLVMEKRVIQSVQELTGALDLLTELLHEIGVRKPSTFEQLGELIEDFFRSVDPGGVDGQ